MAIPNITEPVLHAVDSGFLLFTAEGVTVMDNNGDKFKQWDLAQWEADPRTFTEALGVVVNCMQNGFDTSLPSKLDESVLSVIGGTVEVGPDEIHFLSDSGDEVVMWCSDEWNEEPSAQVATMRALAYSVSYGIADLDFYLNGQFLD